MATNRKKRSLAGFIASLVSRLIFIVGLGICLFVIAGFFKFADDVVNMTPPKGLKPADGIVSLTGGSRARLTEGINLLQEGMGKKLLISGVFKDAKPEELRLVTGGDKELYECCVMLGKEATDTIGNAREIHEWARANNFKRLIIITDNYHIKRSMLEINFANSDIEFIPYPVRAEPFMKKNWWENQDAVRRLTIEYSKYVLAQLRLITGFDPEHE